MLVYLYTVLQLSILIKYSDNVHLGSKVEPQQTNLYPMCKTQKYSTVLHMGQKSAHNSHITSHLSSYNTDYLLTREDHPHFTPDRAWEPLQD